MNDYLGDDGGCDRYDDGECRRRIFSFFMGRRFEGCKAALKPREPTGLELIEFRAKPGMILTKQPKLILQVGNAAFDPAQAALYFEFVFHLLFNLFYQSLSTTMQ